MSNDLASIARRGYYMYDQLKLKFDKPTVVSLGSFSKRSDTPDNNSDCDTVHAQRRQISNGYRHRAYRNVVLKLPVDYQSY